MPKNVVAHLALFAVAAIYGGNYLVAKVILDDDYLQPRAFIMFRVLVATALFWIISPYFRGRVNKKDMGYLALCGLFGVAINQIFFFSGLKLTTPIHASLIMITTPILVLIAAYFILGESLRWQKILGILLGLAGAGYLILYGAESLTNRAGIWKGDLLVFINASAYGIYLVLVKRMMKKYHPMVVIRWVFTFGLVFVLPFGLMEVSTSRFADFDTNIWLAFVYVLLFTTFLAYYFNTYALKYLSPTVVGAYIYLQPILATLLSLYFGKDQLSLHVILTAILIFTGIILISRRGENP